MNYGYVPWVDTKAGACLTALNWQEAGIKAVAYSLEALLIKPGPAVLKQFAALADFVSWTGPIILDARMPEPNKAGLYILQSPYDGSKLSLSVQELITSVADLAPDYVLLPSGIERSYPEFSKELPDTIRVLLSEEGASDSPALGSYQAVKEPQGQLSGLSLKFNNEELAFLSDQPLSDACEGLIYTNEGPIDLKQAMMAMQFEALDPSCQCRVCQQGFTRAYLHHLLEHTPLLCHRFLIQHNVDFVNNS